MWLVKGPYDWSVMGPLKSIVISILASAAATYLLRQLVSAAGAPGGPDSPPRRPYTSVVVVVPILVGNSENHIFHAERRPGIFGR